MRFSFFASLLVSAFLIACNGRDSRPSGDAGATDAGGATDGPTADAAAGSDGGPADAGPMCTPEILEPFDGRPCPASVRECAEACTDADCVGACIEAAPAGDCAFCLDLSLIACVNRNGCQDEWNCYRECVRTMCPVVTDECLDTNCPAPEDAFNACVTDEVLEICGTRYLDCVME
jgi:hypothetical protein